MEGLAVVRVEPEHLAEHLDHPIAGVHLLERVLAQPVAQAAGHHTGNVIVVHFGAAFKGGQGTGGPVGDDVATETIHIQLTANRGDAQTQIVIDLNLVKTLLSLHHALLQGLLAKANRGLLYVDEVNLLDDHLVDVLLDSAASGWNTVEREGVSVRHPARFVLIGSGNPEEGELRPQLLDRFGMSVEVRTVRDPEQRVQVVDQRGQFDTDPVSFLTQFQGQQQGLQEKVVAAQERLGSVQMDPDLRLKISEVCGQLEVDGLRGDIVTNRAARALAAFEGRAEVNDDDVARVVACCLRHRLRKDPLEQVDSGDRVVKVFCQVFGLNPDDREAFQLALAA